MAAGHEKLTEEIEQERREARQRMREATGRLAARLDESGVTFDLRRATDQLEVTIGDRHGFFYTQRGANAQLHLDPNTHDIVGITIDKVSEYGLSHGSPAFHDLLRTLEAYGKIHIFPQDQGAERLFQDLRELVAA
ncbi:MAG: hypothetical protein M3P30_16255 [Chloroflexota bacterium]|nr:hypothetical protein [Chloroflexota bacterium]